jgi:hypothetical protein
LQEATIEALSAQLAEATASDAAARGVLASMGLFIKDSSAALDVFSLEAERRTSEHVRALLR